MSEETVGIDCEFNNSNEKIMNVLACVLSSREFGELKNNLTDKTQVTNFKEQMNCIQQSGATLLAFAVAAEARSLLSLGINPLMFRWIDLYVEFRMLCNSNDRWNHGYYIPKTGGSGYSTPPNPSASEEERENDHEDHTETPKNLINAVFKLLNVRLDADEKDAMRDLILSKNDSLIQERMNEILDYCASDTKYLRALDIAIQREYKKEGLDDFRSDQYSRGRYSVATALCEHIGLPIDNLLLTKIIEQTPNILQTHKDEVNVHFNFFIPDYQRPPITRKNGSTFTYKPTPAHKDMASYQRYVETLNIPNFPRTKTGKYKLDKDTLEEFGYWGGLESLWKYNKTESSLKWFNKENGDGFFDRFGSDNRVRPYYGIFGTQTGRNAAKAKTFPLAMSSWLRAIIKPTTNSFIIGADFSQQEVYVAAILSGDKNLLNAYLSGDVYLAFAKQAGLVPETATKTSHKLERDLCKSTVLGLQFGMGHQKLKMKLRLDSGQDVSDEKTAELITAHKTVFSRYWQWVYEVTNEYKAGNPLSTTDGWVLFCDNPSIPSVRNFLVQGNAASITRRAIVLLVERGHKVLCGLHDAVYVETDNIQYTESEMGYCMEQATIDILKEDNKTNIRLDFKTIGCDDIWVEDKGKKDWDKLKQFLLDK
jgi:DNA polymerase-1